MDELQRSFERACGELPELVRSRVSAYTSTRSANVWTLRDADGVVLNPPPVATPPTRTPSMTRMLADLALRQDKRLDAIEHVLRAKFAGAGAQRSASPYLTRDIGSMTRGAGDTVSKPHMRWDRAAQCWRPASEMQPGMVSHMTAHGPQVVA